MLTDSFVDDNAFEGTVDGIFYRVHASSRSKPWIMLLMGYSGSLDSWGPSFTNSLAQQANLILIDNRGTGRSIREESVSHHTVSLYADDAVKVVDSLGLRQVTVAGFSLGGCIAQEIASRDPSWLRSIALISTTAGGKRYVRPQDGMLEQLSSPAGETVLEKSMSLWSLCMSQQAMQKCLDELKLIHEIQSLHLTPRITFAGQMIAFRKFANVSKSERDGVIITGKDDRLMPMGNSNNLLELFPNARFVSVEGVEHMPHLECRDLLVSVLVNAALRSQ